MATTTEVPGRFPVAIDGQPFQLVLGEFQRATLETIRQQADASSDPGEQSLNPNDLWRRAQSEWHFGTGQEWLDRDDSLRARSWRSVGIDGWHRGELTLLHDVERVDEFASGVIGKAVLANGQVYVNRGDHVSRWDGTTWVDCDDLASGLEIRDLATDGYNVYLAVNNDAHDAGGIYVVTGDSDTPTKLNDLITDVVGFKLGRLMAGAGPDVYNVTNYASTDAPDPLTTLVNSEWTWDCFGEGPSFIYAAGHSGDTSMIYRFGIREDGTSLQGGAVARQMPDGETVHTMSLYRGIVVLGTSKGVRVALPQGSSLQEGRLIEVGPVRGLEPQGDYVWFTMAGQADGKDGLGRLDLGRFVESITPAYAADLAAADVGTPLSVLTYGGRRLFVLDGVGVYQESDDFRLSGWLDTGKWTHGLDDKKVFYTIEGRHEPLLAGQEVSIEVFIDGGETAAISGTSDVVGASDAGPWSPTTPQLGEFANGRITLTGTADAAPTLTRWLGRSFPVPRRSEGYRLPLDLRRTVTALGGDKQSMSPETLYDWLKAKEKAGLPVQVQEWTRTFDAFIDRVQLGGVTMDDRVEDRWWQGTCFVTLRVFDEAAS